MRAPRGLGGWERSQQRGLASRQVYGLHRIVRDPFLSSRCHHEGACRRLSSRFHKSAGRAGGSVGVAEAIGSRTTLGEAKGWFTPHKSTHARGGYNRTEGATIGSTDPFFCSLKAHRFVMPSPSTGVSCHAHDLGNETEASLRRRLPPRLPAGRGAGRRRPDPGRPAAAAGPAGAAGPVAAQGGHHGLPVRRPAAPGHVRPQAGRPGRVSAASSSRSRPTSPASTSAS